MVSAHGVDRNHQWLGQDGALVLRRVPPDSDPTIAPRPGNANTTLPDQASPALNVLSIAKGESGPSGGAYSNSTPGLRAKGSISSAKCSMT